MSGKNPGPSAQFEAAENRIPRQSRYFILSAPRDADGQGAEFFPPLDFPNSKEKPQPCCSHKGENRGGSSARKLLPAGSRYLGAEKAAGGFRPGRKPGARPMPALAFNILPTEASMRSRAGALVRA